MAVVMVAAAPPWPRRWSDQQPLLEQQHDRLESLQQQLLQQRFEAEEPPCDTPAALALETSCRRRLWDLRLHLRLEERWLGAVQTWFNGHRHGPDAMAYALATSRAKASQPISDQRPISIAPQP